jgi:ABC-type thiamine transport system substrate-binding protein
VTLSVFHVSYTDRSDRPLYARVTSITAGSSKETNLWSEGDRDNALSFASDPACHSFSDQPFDHSELQIDTDTKVRN